MPCWPVLLADEDSLLYVNLPVSAGSEPGPKHRKLSNCIPEALAFELTFRGGKLAAGACHLSTMLRINLKS